MTKEELVDWLHQSNTLWACLDIFENLTDGCRRRISPQDEITWAFWYFHDEVRFHMLQEAHGDLGIAKSLQWLSDNSERILAELHASHHCISPWLSVFDRVSFTAQFFGRAVDRIATHHQQQVALQSQSEEQF